MGMGMEIDMKAEVEAKVEVEAEAETTWFEVETGAEIKLLLDLEKSLIRSGSRRQRQNWRRSWK